MRTEEVIAGIFNGIVNAYNMVSNVECLPYAVFQVNENPVSNKDGVYRYDHGVVINVVAGNFDECKDISDRVMKNLLSLRNDAPSVTNLAVSGETDGDIYMRKMECLIIEFV